MSHTLIARRYATVLFEIVTARGQADRVLSELGAIQDLIDHHADLRQVFETPALPAAKKRAIVDALAARLEFSPEVTRLLALLADRDRLGQLRDITGAFTDRLMVARKIVSAEVTTAAPLGAAGRTALIRALGEAVGCDVTLREHVDPAIIGGLVAQVGSLVFDGSVTRQLDRMKERLIAEA